MESWWSRITSAVIPRGIVSVPGSLLAVLLGYSFSSQFIPVEPYLVPYLTSIKGFSNFQITVDIYPISVYAQLVFTLLLAPACFYLSHKAVIILGAFGLLATYVIIWVGQSLLSMQIMQLTYGFGMSARLVFSSYIFHLVLEEEYQIMTSLTTTTSLLSFMLASELSQFLALAGVSYDMFFVISLTALGICCAMTFLLPKDPSLYSLSSLTSWGENEGWIFILKQTWGDQNLRILSLWWAIAFAGMSLVQNYGTNLFDAVDPKSKYNGHILAISQAAGSLGAYCAIYIKDFASKSGLSIYVIGSSVMGLICTCMGIIPNIWVDYFLYVLISGIYQTLSCLLSVQCGRLLSNGQFILLFSINNFAGLLIETLLQAAVEVSGLSIFAQFISFAIFFFVATIAFVGVSCINFGQRKPIAFFNLDSEAAHLIAK
ncbi:Reduced folate carrier protein [Dioscorea alata]|uniref:Reduced folate carrier protein n=2 Tax=Dioscorea alata TaxID=55571 RepID=A0ACB7VI85_DIOAL|nr:Reduced folate carrier protein [Dioscorea alata]